ncbi:MAG: HAD hydrolase-like protein, partial [Dehalococcoidia bacterium]
MAQDRNRLTITGGRGAPQGITTVVFDFDDTIADTLPARVDAMRRTFETAGITTPTAEAYMTANRGVVPLQEGFDAFDGGRGAEMGLLDIYRSAYWSKEPGLVWLFEGVRDMLDGLASVDIRMGCLTSKSRDIVVDGRTAGTV